MIALLKWQVKICQKHTGIPQIDFFKGRLEIFHGIGEEMLSRCTFQALITYF